MNNDIKKIRKNVLKNILSHNLYKILNHYGLENAKRKLNEEVFELIEVMSVYNYTSNDVRITEELADVYNMLEQVKMFYNISEDDIFEIQMQKSDRQLIRIKQEDNK